MFVKSFFLKGLSHISYILGAGRKCAVIDPRRDIDIYLEEAGAMGYTITHILETHLHADFISGHIELAKKTGAKIAGPRSADMQFDHEGLADGDEFSIEHVKIRVMETPGHTPEHISYIVTDTSRGGEPCVIFTGDTLFVGDAGRPDLFPGRADELAEKLFHSLNKIMKLPDFVEVFPAHGAGSLCGKAISAKRSSTIGYERLYNPVLQHKNLETFKKRLLSGMPSAPDHFKRCSAMNRAGATPLNELPQVKLLSPWIFHKLAKKDEYLVLDVRDFNWFCGSHIPGAINIDTGSNFPTFAGWLLPVDKTLLLVTGCPEELEKALLGLRRVGLDKVEGVLEDGMYKWEIAALPVETIPQMSVHEIRKKCMSGEINLLDVRSEKEFEAYHIERAENLPAPDARENFAKVKEPAAVICNSGQRSAMAASILQNRGVKNIINVPGGMTAWKTAGYSDACPCVEITHGPKLSGKPLS